MIRGASSQVIGAQMVNATTGAAFVGTVTVYVTLDGGTQAIGTVGSGLCTSEGNGYYTYTPSAAETDGLLVAFTFIGTGAIPATIQIATVTATQQATLGSGSVAGAITTRDLIIEMFEDITVLAPGDVLDETDATRALKKLTRLFDNWNAEQSGVYGSSPNSYTLTANQNPHTIGPAGSSPDFTVTQRPVSIDAANLVVGTGTTAIHYPLDLVNQDWYASIPLPGLATWPYALYYSTDWPLGNIYLFPVPDTAYGLQLWTRTVLADLALDDVISFPPGYRDAVILTLGEMLAPTYPPAVAQPEAAAKARARIFANNDQQPTLATADAGCPRPKPGGGWSIINFYRGY